jgi:hypothetical protein
MQLLKLASVGTRTDRAATVPLGLIVPKVEKPFGVVAPDFFISTPNSDPRS